MFKKGPWGRARKKGGDTKRTHIRESQRGRNPQIDPRGHSVYLGKSAAKQNRW